jgi:hypothetical protein
MLFHSIQGAGGFLSGLPTITYNNDYLQAKGSTTVTFTSVDFGYDASDRVVAIYVSSGTLNSGTVSGVTIGGITATLAEQSTTDFRFNAIYYAEVPTGASGNVVVTFSTGFGNSTDAYLSCVSMYGLSSTTPIKGISQSTSTGVTPSRSVTLTPEDGAVLFAGYSAGAVADGSTSLWTNATEQTDLLNGTTAYTDAISSNLLNSSLTVSATNTDSTVNRPTLVVATWR